MSASWSAGSTVRVRVAPTGQVQLSFQHSPSTTHPSHTLPTCPPAHPACSHDSTHPWYGARAPSPTPGCPHTWPTRSQLPCVPPAGTPPTPHPTHPSPPVHHPTSSLPAPQPCWADHTHPREGSGPPRPSPGGLLGMSSGAPLQRTRRMTLQHSHAMTSWLQPHPGAPDWAALLCAPPLQ